MASIRISQLSRLASASFTGDDFFPVVDSASMTTYRVPLSALNSWLSVYGTASWATGSLSSSFARTASFTTSASWANQSSQSVFSLTALSADFAVLSDFADSSSYARTASSLQGIGTSYERNLTISSSLIMAPSSSFQIARRTAVIPINPADLIKDCVFLNSAYGVPGWSTITNDWGRIYFTEPTLNVGRIVFEHGDDLDSLYVPTSSAASIIEYQYRNAPGYLFSTLNTDGYYATGSLMFLSTAGKLYTRGIESNDYTASIVANKVGFFGTASCAVTASYVSNIPVSAVNVTPSFVKNLSIRPNWTPYDASNIPIDILVDEIIVHDTDSPSNAKRLSSDSYTLTFTNNRSSPGAGGLVGAFTQDQWYDIWVIYDSTNDLVSTTIVNSGASPKQSTLSSALTGTYDYGARIGSVLDEGAIFWRQWYQYGSQTLWAYRNALPNNSGLTAGYTLTHYLNTTPKKVWTKVKLKLSNSYTNTAGFSLGDEFRENDFFNNIDGSSEDGPPFAVISTDTGLKFWRGLYYNGFWLPTTNGTWIDWPYNYFDIIIYSEI